MNDPIMVLANVLRSGGNPANLLQQMAAQNPQARQVMQIMQGKSPEQLREIASNMARERGTSLEDVARSLGIQIPSER